MHFDFIDRPIGSVCNIRGGCRIFEGGGGQLRSTR